MRHSLSQIFDFLSSFQILEPRRSLQDRAEFPPPGTKIIVLYNPPLFGEVRINNIVVKQRKKPPQDTFLKDFKLQVCFSDMDFKVANQQGVSELLGAAHIDLFRVKEEGRVPYEFKVYGKSCKILLEVK